MNAGALIDTVEQWRDLLEVSLRFVALCSLLNHMLRPSTLVVS